MKREFDKYVQYIFHWDNPLLYALFIVGLLILFAYIVYFHIFIPNKKQHLKEKMDAEIKSSRVMTEKYRSLALQLQEKLEMEKQRLGRELHDSIGQNLLLFRMKLCNSPENLNGLLNVIDSTIYDLKEIIFDLKPRALEDLGLTSAVINLCEHINKSSGLQGNVNVTGSAVTLPREKELYLYRIIQECLNNIIKHSGAKEYNIEFIYGSDSLKIMTIDEGRGMDVEAAMNGKGNGLFNIEERIKYLGGKMKITSSEDEGTLLLMEIPYDGQKHTDINL